MPEWTPRQLIARRDWAPGLASFTFDGPAPEFEPGQFVQLTLENGERPLKRAYSVASAPGRPLELFIVELPGGALTPALFAAPLGTPAWSSGPAGLFTLQEVGEGSALWLICTGTGLAPFLSMLRSGKTARFSKVVVVHGVRRRADLAYGEELAALGAVLVPVVSREEPPAGGVAGRIPAAIADGRLEAAAGAALGPESQVMLCGNPEMLAEAMATLEQRGLRKHRRREPGQVHCERYW